MRRWKLRALTLTVAHASLLNTSCGAPQTNDECGAQLRQPIFHGTEEESYLRLSAREQAAVVAVVFDPENKGFHSPCSGALVHPDFVLTAGHCALRVAAETTQVRFGTSMQSADYIAPVAAIELHPVLDAALLRLESSAPASLAQAIPPSLLPAESYLRARVVLAGYGATHLDTFGRRQFVTEPVSYVEGYHLVVDGADESGACTSDSGGPALFRDERGPVVIGLLESGDASCVGRDNYVSAAQLAPWLEAHGAMAPFDAERDCGVVTAAGACHSFAGPAIATWCENGVRSAELCTADERCGWDAQRGGFRCVAPSDDACLGVSSFGECHGRTRRQCVAGLLHEDDCAACAVCAIEPSTGAARCR